MFHELRPSKRLALPAGLLIFFTLLGCGLREAQTGGLQSRLIDVDGDIVASATVYSLFAASEKVMTGKDGTFYLSELPKGLNTIVISHKEFSQETRRIEIAADQVTRIDFIRLDQANASRKISETAVESVSSSTAVITWKTYKDLLCQIQYGTDQNYGQAVDEKELSTVHRMTITGLIPDTVYHARIRYLDENSNWYLSYDLPFKTSPGDAPAPCTSLTLSPLSSYGTVSLQWGISTSTRVVGYRVFRREKGGDWVRLTTDDLDRKTISFTDKTCTGGKFYQYSVSAISDEGAASPKNESKTVFMPGFIDSDFRLTASDSPILLMSDLIIGLGVNFYVEGGVEFQVASSDVFRLGLDKDHVELLVYGRASIQGTKANPVKFTPFDGNSSRNHWNGINVFKGGTGTSEFSFVELFGCRPFAIAVDGSPANIHDISVKYCVGGLSVSNAQNSPALTNCTFEDISSAAVVIKGCRRYEISSCLINKAGTGALFRWSTTEDRVTIKETSIYAIDAGVNGNFARSLIKNSLFVVPDGVGIQYNQALGEENDLDHCTIDAKRGIFVASGAPTITNNIVTSIAENGTNGIKFTSATTPLLDYNDVYGFSTPYEGCGEGTGARRVKPDFVGGNPYDYHLEVTSPLKSVDNLGHELGRYGESFL